MRGIEVIANKGFTQIKKNGVQMGNGTISLFNVRMNVYVFCVDGVLIDTGSQSLEKQFRPFFDDLTIDQVALTHYHEDHTGGAAFLQQKYQLPILMNERMIEYCSKKADYPLYRKLFWGKRKPFAGKEVGSTFTSSHATWDVIETPGHSMDHLSFLNRQTGQLFTGDLYCTPRTKVVLREEHVPDIINSLKRALTYDFKEVYCCHAGYLENGRQALQRKLDYLLGIQETIIQQYKGGRTPEQINESLYPTKYPITKFSMGEWDSIHIINSILIEYDKENKVLK